MDTLETRYAELSLTEAYVRQQRDELVAALRDLTSECEAGILNGHAIARARGALTKVQS